MADERQDEPEDLDVPPSFFPTNSGETEELGSVDYGDPVLVHVEAVLSAESDGTEEMFVLLSDGERKLPIAIGPCEATAITLALAGQQPGRPQTHDLFRNTLDRCGISVTRMIIDDLWRGTYYAKLTLQFNDEDLEIDSRPSDAIAVTLRFEAPIYVAEGILERNSP